LKPNKEEQEFLNKYVLSDSMTWLIPNVTIRVMKNIIRRMRDLSNLKGKLGEIYVYDCLYNQLINYGFKYSKTAKKNSFYMRRYYRAKRRHGDGIDVYLVIQDNNGKKYKCMIEISNWMKMHTINQYIWHQRIQSKFDKYDKLDRCFHINAINHRNVKLIGDKAKRDGTIILPLREHITPSLVKIIDEDGELLRKLAQKV